MPVSQLNIYEEKEYNDYNFGGTVAVTYGSTSDNTEDCYNYNIEEGVSVTFKATPKDGYEFLRWEKDGNTLTTNTTCTFTAKADETYMAVFGKKATTQTSCGRRRFLPKAPSRS